MAITGTVTSRYVVLDANYLVSDWQLTSLSSVLLRRMTEEHWGLDPGNWTRGL